MTRPRSPIGRFIQPCLLVGLIAGLLWWSSLKVLGTRLQEDGSPSPAGLESTDVLTYAQLVGRLIDLEALAVLPAPGEACRQWSSYDRASRYDSDAKKYVNWDANDDGSGFVRREGRSYVLAEMEGPGCIYRIWSAAPANGHVRIYLDGDTRPAVDLPFSGYFDLQHPPFIYPSLVHITASGYNCYVPIPFERSCKVTADEGWGRYYHITYATFPKYTRIPTFRRELSAEERSALRRVDQFLTNGLGRDPAGQRPQEATEKATVSLGPGESEVVAGLAGEGAITGIGVRLLGEVDDPSVILRELVLRASWDGESRPSVWAPLGDYFGTAPGINPYRSLPLGMSDDGFYSYWYMPFATQALIEVGNEGTHRVTLEFSLSHAPLSRPIGELGRFHAKWHRDCMLPNDSERAIDWTLLKVQGLGRYCGTTLHVWNPKGQWWGEGDEKFFVDGESFPSTFGTGSEDYFGYAWCDPTLFEHAYHSQTVCDNDNAGHVSVNRWQIADSVPFQSSFEGVIEKYFSNDRPTLYDCVVYWYQAPSTIDPYHPVPGAERFAGYREIPLMADLAVDRK